LPTYGALGVGGIVSFVFGSVLLFEPSSGLTLPLGLILPTAIGIGLGMLGLAYLAFRVRRKKRSSGLETMINAKARVVKVDESSQPTAAKTGKLEVWGEIWNFISEESVSMGRFVIITGVDGLTLRVKPE